MPALDVTDAILSPDFADTFTVQRRKETINRHGRSSVNDVTYPNIIGVVTVASPNDLAREPEYEIFTRSISIVTKFRLQGEVTGYQPDVVIWRGNKFLVNTVEAYPHFGPGFYQVSCTSVERTDTEAANSPLEPGPLFSLVENSIYAEVLLCN